MRPLNLLAGGGVAVGSIHDEIRDWSIRRSARCFDFISGCSDLCGGDVLRDSHAVVGFSAGEFSARYHHGGQRGDAGG
jgi:hypothetical protein